MFRTLFKKIAVSLFLLCFTVFGTAVFANVTAPFAAFGLDTIAGSETVLRTSKLSPNSPVEFVVLNPYGESSVYKAKTNANGVAVYSVPESATKIAGAYRVAVRTQGRSSAYDTFDVFSGLVSPENSKLQPLNQVLTKDEDANIQVKLLDDHSNPVPRHSVKLISSNPADKIKVIDDVSDSQGRVSFKVQPVGDGVRQYSVYDVTADLVLKDVAKVARVSSDNFSNYLMLNTLGASNPIDPRGNASGPIDTFMFEDIPDEINPGEDVSLTVAAVDSQGEVVSNYDGTVRFSVNGSNSSFVSLPEDYTFTVEDQGKHTFSLAFSFQELGSYELQVTDIDNIDVFATEDLSVVKSEDSLSESPGGGNLNLRSPVPGTYSNAVQVVSGVTSPGAKLKIYDNDSELASIVSDFTGSFNYTTPALADGVHEIYVAQVNDVGTILKSSSVVNLVIDTSAPDISNVVVEPEMVVAGSTATIKVFSDSDLSSVSVIIADLYTELVKVSDGVYQADFVASLQPGSYPVEVISVDLLGNESRMKDVIAVKVVEKESDDMQIPPDVTGLKAKAADGRVVLIWDAIVGADVDHFRVLYGSSPSELTEAVDTFTDALTWYVPNLENSKEYYFAVIAVGANGESSKNLSNIVSATPLPPVVEVGGPEVDNGTAGAEALEEMERDVSDSGPGVYWLFFASLFAGYFYVRLRPVQRQ